MKSFRDLQIWQRGMDLSVLVYRQTLNLPKEELFGLTSQLRRAATSIPLNISEGWGRGSDKSFANYIKIARGSIFELDTTLELCYRLNYISVETFQSLQLEIETLGKMLNGFLKTLDKE